MFVFLKGSSLNSIVKRLKRHSVEISQPEKKITSSIYIHSYKVDFYEMHLKFSNTLTDLICVPETQLFRNAFLSNNK